MELTNNYLLAGGIASVVMHPASSTIPDDFSQLGSDSCTMILHHEGSSYSEIRGCEDGLYTVLHRLTLVGYIGEDMATDYYQRRLMREGIIADVTLISGAQIRIGYSSRFGAEAPLRLVSSEMVSGEKRLDYPLKKWVWESVDTSTLI